MKEYRQFYPSTIILHNSPKPDFYVACSSVKIVPLLSEWEIKLLGLPWEVNSLLKSVYSGSTPHVSLLPGRDWELSEPEAALRLQPALRTLEVAAAPLSLLQTQPGLCALSCSCSETTRRVLHSSRRLAVYLLCCTEIAPSVSRPIREHKALAVKKKKKKSFFVVLLGNKGS